ncbi:MAG: hypothetical protein AVDCRST_MAG53-631, partial [uncultured Solirubrobacteraceae bacterium]
GAERSAHAGSRGDRSRDPGTARATWTRQDDLPVGGGTGRLRRRRVPRPHGRGAFRGLRSGRPRRDHGHPARRGRRRAHRARPDPAGRHAAGPAFDSPPGTL